MNKQLISLLIATALVSFVCTRTSGATLQEQKEAEQVAAVKARITELGIGTLVEIKLRDKTKLKGYVGQIAKDYFVVTNAKTGAEINVPYTQLQQIKRGKDRHLSDRKMFAIALGVVFALFAWANATDKP